MSSGPSRKPEDINISVISGSFVDNKSDRTANKEDSNVENPSMDSGCYVNNARRDSTVYLEDDADDSKTDVGACVVDTEKVVNAPDREPCEDVNEVYVNPVSSNS